MTLIYDTDPDSQFFDGRISKLTSQLAAQATIAFYREVVKRLPPEYAERLPTFDARAWVVPTIYEAINAILWREQDATKNSITMAASTVYSHQALHKKNSKEKQEMLFAKGINWNHYPTAFKRGTYVQRVIVSGPITVDELNDLPPLHHARTNPDLIVERSRIQTVEIPPLASIANPIGVLLMGADPIIKE